MFKIIKKGANNFWHYYNNDAKKLYVSKITFNLEEVANTFVLVQANGSNVPANKVLVTDIIVIDETDASIEETFATAEELRVRLNELGYGVVSSGGGGIPDAPNNSNAYVRSALSWVIGYTKTAIDNLLALKQNILVAGDNITIDNTDPLNPIISSTGGGGDVPTLQEVTDEGNTTDNSIIINNDVDSKFLSVQNNSIGSEITIFPYKIYHSNSGGEGAINITFEETTDGNFQEIIVPNESGIVATREWVADNINASPTLQEVTDNGNTTTNAILIPELQLYDTATDAYAKINYLDGQFDFRDINGRIIKVIEKDGLEQTLNQNDFYLTKEISSLTDNRTRTEPDKDGTYAMLDDIPGTDDFVQKSDYTPAHSVLVQQSGTGSPTSVQINNNQILGRLSGGGSNIKGLSTSEVKTLLDLSGTNSGDNATNTTSNAYADAKVAENIKTLTLASPATTTSTTAVATNLSTPIAIGETLKFNLDLVVSTSSGGIKIQINVPTGGVLKGGLITANTLSTSARVLGMIENTLTLAVITTASSIAPIQIGFTIDSTTATGDVVLAFASGSGGSTTIDKGSSMQIFKPTLV